MITKQVILAGFAAIVLGVGAADAGTCNSGGKDAGSGPTPGYTGQTIGMGSPKVDQHPPTETMNRVAGEKATSSQDTQRQQQGQPTAAQQAQGAEPSAKMTDDNQPRASQPTQGAQPSEKMAEQGC
jgi:hypothetical protein